MAIEEAKNREKDLASRSAPNVNMVSLKMEEKKAKKRNIHIALLTFHNT